MSTSFLVVRSSYTQGIQGIARVSERLPLGVLINKKVIIETPRSILWVGRNAASHTLVTSFLVTRWNSMCAVSDNSELCARHFFSYRQAYVTLAKYSREAAGRGA